MKLPVTLLALFAVLLSGCMKINVGGEARDDSTRYYVLGPADESAGPTVDETIKAPDEEVTIGLRPIDMPGYLDTTKLVIRRGANRIDYTDDHLWAENLEAAIARGLTERLRQYPGIVDTLNYPWPDGAKPDFTVRLIVNHFEGDVREKAAVVVINWKCTYHGRNGHFREGRTSYVREWDTRDYAELADLLTQGLDQLTRDIARVLPDMR